MKNDTYYYCQLCQQGYTFDELDRKLVLHGYHYGNGCSAPDEYDNLCPDCGDKVVEGYMCEACQEIFESLEKHTWTDANGIEKSSRVCRECLLYSLVDDAYIALQKQVAEKFSSITGVESETSIESDIDEILTKLIKGE